MAELGHFLFAFLTGRLSRLLLPGARLLLAAPDIILERLRQSPAALGSRSAVLTRLGHAVLSLATTQESSEAPFASGGIAGKPGRCDMVPDFGIAPGLRVDLPAFRRHKPRPCCRSSVVEHPLGKGEVVSSILPGSTIRSPSHFNKLLILKVH